MEYREPKFRVRWFWGLAGSCGILGLILGEPGYYAFFSLFLFFVEPLVRAHRSKKKSQVATSRPEPLLGHAEES